LEKLPQAQWSASILQQLEMFLCILSLWHASVACGSSVREVQRWWLWLCINFLVKMQTESLQSVSRAIKKLEKQTVF